MPRSLQEIASGDAALGFLAKYSDRPKTYSAYRMGLEWFLDWCQTHDLDPRDLRPYHFDLLSREMQQKWRPRTVALRMTSIRGFFKYLVERGEVDVSPVPGDWSTNIDRESQSDLLTADELDRLIAEGVEAGGVDAIVVTLLTAAFLKPGQIEAARVDHLTINSNGSVSIASDAFGSIFEVLTIRGAPAEILREWVKGRSSGLLLQTRVGTPFNRNAVARVLERLCKAAGLETVSPNKVRMSAIAQLGALAGDGEFRPRRMRKMIAGAARPPSSVDPTSFAKELIAISDVLLEEVTGRPIAAVALTGTALEYFLRSLAIDSGSTSTGGGIEAWAGALRSLGVITKQEKKKLSHWSGLRDIAVHGVEEEPLSLDDARSFNTGLAEFISRHVL